MASGRVGGTKAKITGQVGQTIYQVRKNPDGTYTQVTMKKGERTEEVTSPRLQAQRMCTAMVESMMKDLKEVARISMQSAPNKSKSLNAFSANNLRLVAQDCKANWYGNQMFVYPFRDVTKEYVQDLGGTYLISAGTLQFDVFDQKVFSEMPAQDWDTPYIGLQFMYGVQFNVNMGTDTVEDFLRKHRMTRLDYFVFCGFDGYTDWESGGEDPQTKYKHIYCIAQLNPSIPSDMILTADNVNQLFVWKSNAEFDILAKRDGSAVALAYLADYASKDEQLYYDAAFSISYLDGRKKISSSTYHNPDGSDEPWIIDYSPSMVFGSWMGQPSVKPWPSPFE